MRQRTVIISFLETKNSAWSHPARSASPTLLPNSRALGVQVSLLQPFLLNGKVQQNFQIKQDHLGQLNSSVAVLKGGFNVPASSPAPSERLGYFTLRRTMQMPSLLWTSSKTKTTGLWCFLFFWPRKLHTEGAGQAQATWASSVVHGRQSPHNQTSSSRETHLQQGHFSSCRTQVANILWKSVE